MKKSKFVIGVLVLAIMLMGAGYAAWSEQFTVTATVNAGEFDYTLAKENMTPATHLYMTPTFDVDNTADSKSVTIGLGNLYPDQDVVYQFSITNNGTMGIIPTISDYSLLMIKGNGAPLNEENGTLSVMYSLTGASGSYMYYGPFKAALENNVIGITGDTTQDVYVKIAMTDTEDQTFEQSTVALSFKVSYQQSDLPAADLDQ